MAGCAIVLLCPRPPREPGSKQKLAPSPLGEGWGEGRPLGTTVASIRCLDKGWFQCERLVDVDSETRLALALNPHPSPLPRERELVLRNRIGTKTKRATGTFHHTSVIPRSHDMRRKP